MKRHESQKEQIAKGDAKLLMIGDSITHGWEGSGKKTWEKYYGKRNAVNLGIGGDRTQHVLWRLQNVGLEKVKPTAAVIMIGTNNRDQPEQTAEGIKAILDLLKEKQPQMKVLLLAIFPRGGDNNDKLRQTNEKINKIIPSYCDGKQVVFLNINEKFLEKDGTLTREVMPDLLHPREKGYGIWAEAIEEPLKKLLGEK